MADTFTLTGRPRHFDETPIVRAPYVIYAYPPLTVDVDDNEVYFDTIEGTTDNNGYIGDPDGIPLVTLPGQYYRIRFPNNSVSSVTFEAPAADAVLDLSQIVEPEEYPPLTPSLVSQALDAADAAAASAAEAEALVGLGLDSDLAAIADLDTQPYGRSLLELGDATALHAEMPYEATTVVGAAPVRVTLDEAEDTLTIAADVWGPVDQGMAGWSFDPAVVASATAPGTGSMVGARVKAATTGTVNNLWIHVGTLGTPTTAVLAIYDINGSRLGVTSDQAAAVGSTGSKSCALTSSVSVTAGQTYFVMALQVGGTPAALGRGLSSAPNVGNAGYSGAPVRFVQLTGQTTPPSSFTPSGLASSSVAWWVGMS